MTYRSRRSSKLKQPLAQVPATDAPAVPKSPLPQRVLGTPRPWHQMPVPHEIPVEPKQAPDFRDPSRLPHVAPLTRGEGFEVKLPLTQVLPVVDLTATQPIPVVQDVPPSARHVDPVQHYYEQTFVEDNDLEPQTRGRHVLAELTAGPDVATELMALQNHIHNIFDPMRRAEVAAQASDERMRAFTAQWDARQARTEREFESWAQRFRQSLAATRALWAETSGRTNADRLAMDYAAGGTSAALYTKDQLAAEIARRDSEQAALTGSAVAA